LKWLKEKIPDQIVIKPSDKNMGITIMDSKKYTEDMETHLLGPSYSKIGDVFEFLPELDVIYTNLHKRMIHVSKQLQSRILTSKRKLGIFLDTKHVSVMQVYGLAKLHKMSFKSETIKFRPIVQGFCSITARINDIITHIFTPLMCCIQYRIFNPDRIKDLCNIPKNFTSATKLTSIDIEAMYTSLPHQPLKEEMIKFYNKHKHNLSYYKQIETETLEELLDIYLDSNYFQFNKILYKQNKGITMGASCSPICADIFLSRFESEFITKNLTNRSIVKKIYYYQRYLDDILIICEPEIVQDFLKQLTTQTSLKATIQCQGQQTVFLDYLLYFHNNYIETHLFTKPGAAKHFITPSSSHPMYVKEGVIKSQLIRIRRRSSNIHACIGSALELCIYFFKRGYAIPLLEKELNNWLVETIKKVDLDKFHLIADHPKISKTNKNFFEAWQIKLPSGRNRNQLFKFIKNKLLHPALPFTYPLSNPILLLGQSQNIIMHTSKASHPNRTNPAIHEGKSLLHLYPDNSIVVNIN